MRMILLGIVGIVAMPTASAAQEPIPACQNQQQLEQVLGSDGEIMPEDCWNLNISVLDSDGQRLCLIDLSGADEGIVEQLQEAAVEQRWWMRCEDIEAAVR